MYERHCQHWLGLFGLFFFLTTFSFNFVFVLETMQLLKYYKTLSMHNKFADTFSFCSCIVN